MSNLIIVDRKRKRRNFDDQWTDPLGLEQSKIDKAREIVIDSKSQNPIDRFLSTWSDCKLLLGKEVWAKKSDNSCILSGRIVDVCPGRVLLVKNHDKENIPIRFEDCVTLGG